MLNRKHGRNLRLGKYVVIDDDCEIGENVTIEDFVVVKSGTIIGDNCHIRAGAKIGTPSFILTVEKDKRKRHNHKGVTVLGNGVDIGYNTVIQRGIERNTVIDANTFINSLCNIGHDVHVGKNCIIGLGVEISGHSEIGDNANISPGVTVLNRVRMGQNVFVGIGSLVLHDVSNDTRVVGRPAIEIDKYKGERKALKELIGVSCRTSPISTKKGIWSRRIRKMVYRIKLILLSKFVSNGK